MIARRGYLGWTWEFDIQLETQNDMQYFIENRRYKLFGIIQFPGP